MKDDWLAIIALSGAMLILSFIAIIDLYAIRQCFILAHKAETLPNLCDPEHLFRSAIEIGGMAIGLFGTARLLRK